MSSFGNIYELDACQIYVCINLRLEMLPQQNRHHTKKYHRCSVLSAADGCSVNYRKMIYEVKRFKINQDPMTSCYGMKDSYRP